MHSLATSIGSTTGNQGGANNANHGIVTQIPGLSAPTYVPAPAYQASTTGLRFVLLIEGTVATAQLWPDARAMCVEPLLREMDRGKLGPCEFAVVVYRTPEASYAGAEVESSGWLSSVGEVRQVLDGLQLLGGDQGDACLVDGLLEVMALTEQPSSIGMGGAGPHCQTLLVFASEFSRMGSLMEYPPAPHVTKLDGSDTTAPDKDAGPVFFQQLPNGLWRHTHCSLLSAMKHSHHMSLSVLTLRERLQTGLPLFLCNMLGYCGQGNLIHLIMSANKQAVSAANVPLTTKAYGMFVAPTWPVAKSILVAERQARAGAAGMRGQGPHPIGQQGSTGRMAPTPNSNMPLPSPMVGSTPAYSTPPLQPTPTPGDTGHMGPPPTFSGQHSQQTGMVPQAAGPLPAGMIPTPPSATQAPAHMSGPTGWVPTPGMPGGANPAAGNAAGMRPGGMYPPGANQAVGMDQAAMQQQQQQMGGMGMYPGAQGMARPQGMPQTAYGAQQQQYAAVQQQYAAAAAVQQQQQHFAMQNAWGGGGSGDLSRGGGMQPHGAMQQPAGAAAMMQQQQQQQQQQAGQQAGVPKAVVWTGRLGIHPSLLLSLGMTTPIMLGNCVAEANPNFKPVFTSWPQDLIVSAVMPSKDVQRSLQGGMQTVKVTLRITQPMPSYPALAQAFAPFADDINKNSLLGIVVLPPGLNGRERRVLVQFRSTQLPERDSTINAALIT